MIFLLFVIIHELTHLVVGILLGFKPKKLFVMPFGLKIEFRETKSNKRTELKKFTVAVVGPLINLGLMIIFIILKCNSVLIYTNLIISVFNLIPIFPLDGGRMIKSLLSIKLNTKNAYKITNKLSNICILLLTALRQRFNFVYKKFKYSFCFILFMVCGN